MVSAGTGWPGIRILHMGVILRKFDLQCLSISVCQHVHVS